MRSRLRSLVRGRQRAPWVSTPDSPTAERLGSLLWGGFETSALVDLARLRDDTSAPPTERAGAAYQLACWHLAAGRADAAAADVEVLRRHTPTGVVVLKHLALEVDVLVELGRAGEAGERLDAGLRAQPVDADLWLRRGNVQPAEWLAAVNLVLARGGFTPIQFADPARGAALDNLVGSPSEPLHGPLVSVVMPAYCAASTIELAMRSLLAQTWHALEVLVVDDASPDATSDVVLEAARHDPWIRLLRHRENRGAYAARNTGLAAASGAFVTVHDADDWSHPEKIATQAAGLIQHPDRWGTLTHWVRADDRLVF